MIRYRLTIAYDGSSFHGWQKQELEPGAPSIPASGPLYERNGRAILRTVQEVVEQAVRQVVREQVQVQGASRTDAGVHARAQVCAFTSNPQPARGVGWPAERGTDTLLRALNSRLPEDVLVRRVEIVEPSFDPIGDCEEKGYDYTFHVGQTRPLWDRDFVFHTWHELDASRMQRAAACFVGEHDFSAFCAAGHGRQSTVRTVTQCEVREVATGDDLTPRTRRLRLSIAGTGFLYNMVRIIAGTLHEVGRGKIPADAIPGILASGDRARAGPTLPPEGLCLSWIRYPDGRLA